MEERNQRIVLTGFMGVGKSTVARHLSRMTGKDHEDLDDLIETSESRSIPTMIEESGIDWFRKVETQRLREILDDGSVGIISLGGGTWTLERNRDLIREHGVVSVWLETTFEHCWRNIRSSRKRRPLVKSRAQTKRLFEEREALYCLADWHFVVEPGHSSHEVANRIAAEIFMIRNAGKNRRGPKR